MGLTVRVFPSITLPTSPISIPGCCSRDPAHSRRR
uniref:Uncharacterized protein n=1 Tax=Human herpesvirus 1 TaxID=10298 RepID=A0A2Z4H906_HHV1|nr:hypothetical protein [Human alphaherpesvirus 1]AWW11143.1 hypothetical protein [Human alphaherpesvirus 1]